MPENFEDTKKYALEVQQGLQARNSINKGIDKLYWMEWDDEHKVRTVLGDAIKVTRSPRAANAVEGMVRLLCATDPQFDLPTEYNSPLPTDLQERMQKFAGGMWSAAGKIVGRPLHYDVVRSAVLYDEIHILIQSTNDLVKATKGTAAARRAEEVAQRTPYIFRVTHPSMGYPVYDELGLCFFYSTRKVKQTDILASFGKEGQKAIDRLRKTSVSAYKEVQLHDVYDLEYRTVWIDEQPEPILMEPHGLPFIPIVSAVVEGSSFFEEPERQRRSAIYNLYKSKVIERQNLFLTLIHSMGFGMGGSPMFVEYLHNPNNFPIPDYSMPGGTLRYRVGERREPMAKQIIDPSMMEIWNIDQNLEQESTIYRQTLGEPLGANAPYSMVALLSQSGRLPLLMAQRIGGFAIGRAAEMAFKWMRHDKTNTKIQAGGIYTELAYGDIPEHFEIDARLEIAMPQDMLQNVNAAIMGSQGEEPLFDREWAMEKLLQIQNPAEMIKRMNKAKGKQLLWKRHFNEMLAQDAQTEQMNMNPGSNAGGMPGSMGSPVPVQPQQEGSPYLEGEDQNPFPPLESPFPNMPPMQGPPPQRPPNEVV